GFAVPSEPWYGDPGIDIPMGPNTDPGIVRKIDCPPISNNPLETSEGPVRYADGVVQLRFTDIRSTGFGTSYGQSRSWTNGPGYALNSDMGSWVEAGLPSVIADGDSYAVLSNGTTAYFFD